VTEILTLDLEGWRPALTPAIQESAVAAIEGGGVVVLPRVSFALAESEGKFLSPRGPTGAPRT
jgi:hypothetical protein